MSLSKKRNKERMQQSRSVQPKSENLVQPNYPSIVTGVVNPVQPKPQHNPTNPCKLERCLICHPDLFAEDYRNAYHKEYK